MGGRFVDEGGGAGCDGAVDCEVVDVDGCCAKDEGSNDSEAIGIDWLDDEGIVGAVVATVVGGFDESLGTDEPTNNGVYWA